MSHFLLSVHMKKIFIKDEFEYQVISYYVCIIRASTVNKSESVKPSGLIFLAPLHEVRHLKSSLVAICFIFASVFIHLRYKRVYFSVVI